MNYATLKAELTADPLKLGYAAFVATGNMVAIASLLNALSGPGAGTLTVSRLARDQVLLGMAPMALALASASTALQSKWDRILGLIQAATFVDVGVANPILAQAVSDGIVTQAQVNSLITRACSRAETVLGEGTMVKPADVSKALKSQS